MKLITERNIDELGRIVLPAEIRSKLGITAKSTIRIYEDNGSIVLKKTESSCKLCGSSNQVDQAFFICSECIAKIKKK